jgi:hypothetical protein
MFSSSVRCLDLHLSPPPINRSKKSLPAPISKYVLGIINLWPDYHPQQQMVLNRHGQGKHATKLCPIAAGQNLLYPPIHISFPANKVLSSLNECLSLYINIMCLFMLSFSGYLATLVNSLFRAYKNYSKHLIMPWSYHKNFRVKAFTDLPQQFLQILS